MNFLYLRRPPDEGGLFYLVIKYLTINIKNILTDVVRDGIINLTINVK